MKESTVKISILEKIHLINDIYLNSFHDEPHLFNALRKEDGSKRIENHIFYDILDTMSNTWCCIDEIRQKIGSKISKGEYITIISGCFQILYVQQDLLDELLWICKITNEQTSILRQSIRDIRNELIGHPINTQVLEKEGKKLISTAVWCWSDAESVNGLQKIEYLYRCEGNGSKQNHKVFRLINVLDQHEQYVELCVDLVLNTFKEHLERHINNKQAKVLDILTGENVCVNDLKIAVKLIAEDKVGNFQAWNKMHGYYSFENLVNAIDKIESNERYRYFVRKYFEEVKQIFNGEGTNNSHYREIIMALNGYKKVFEPYEGEFPIIRIVRASDSNQIEMKRSLSESTHYYMSKLFEQKYYSDIATLRRILKDYPKMQNELNHMDKNWSLDKNIIKTEGAVDRSSEMEYYAAILYLQHLISINGDNGLIDQ